MARSPSHKFGQIIGTLLEAAIRPALEKIAADHQLYLDYKHARDARGGKRRVLWRDAKGNDHDLDYVFEEGGTETSLGKPRAFIEVAWRRYTKHSRNKAQEIQAAIVPLAESYREAHPFLGVILAGVFTEGSLTQLRSHGFELLYYPYDTVIAAFRAAGIDIEYNESTPDADLQAKVDTYGSLAEAKKKQVAAKLRNLRNTELQGFLNALRRNLARAVKSVYVLPLYGSPKELASVTDAISFLKGYDESDSVLPFARYEVIVHYTNGDTVHGQFMARHEAIDFLKAMCRSSPENNNSL